MNIFSQFENTIRTAIQAMDIGGQELPDLSRVTVESPRDPAHGDMATNAALALAKPLGMNPRQFAEMLAEKLRADPNVSAAEIAGPGFINLRLSDAFWFEHLRQALASGANYGRAGVGGGTKINVEYVSANPTGPMHVGHCRGAVVGDALANLLAFAGFDVTKEYYINDAGAQIDVLARSVMLRYRQALGENITEIPAGLYPGDYLIPVGEALKAEFGAGLLSMPEEEALEIARVRTIDAMMALIRDDLATLNVHHDVFFSERSLHGQNGGAILSAINDLTFKGHVYKGKLPPPKGEVNEDWEDREQTLFRSTESGDDIDRPLMKSDGSFTYFAADVAYMRNKHERGFKKMIFILGADHGGYVKRMKALAKAVTGEADRAEILLCQLVKLYRNGEPVRMSKRAGEFVTLRDVVEEVGADAVRFMMLYRKAEAPLDFDFGKVTEQSKDNPVFYVQYAHARCASLFRQAGEALPGHDLSMAALSVANLALLTDAGEKGLIAKIAEFPRLIEQAARAYEPHRVAFYLYELASALHQHWSRGKDMPELRFVNQDNVTLTLARLALVRAISAVLSSGLAIVGASAPEEMH